MSKKVIYTCLVGNYDRLIQPSVVNNDFDYICFSNEIKEDAVGVWKIKKIPIELKNRRRLSRYVKIMPHTVLKEYIYSVWIDANIRIIQTNFYDYINNCIKRDELISQVEHPLSNCVYEEIRRAYKNRKVSFYKAYKQYNHLLKMGYPHNYGLYENNLIFRKHNCPKVVQISEDWWREYCEYSERDQFSLKYIYWKHNYIPTLFFEKGKNTRNVSCLSYCRHSQTERHNRRLMRSVLSRFFTLIRSSIILLLFK